ncbi:unnamed protein product [Sympodiomycopsis kandeliae]
MTYRRALSQLRWSVLNSGSASRPTQSQNITSLQRRFQPPLSCQSAPSQRSFHVSPRRFLATPAPPGSTISAPLTSIASSVARLLPQSGPASDIALPRELAEELVGKVLHQVRQAADATTEQEAKEEWNALDKQLRGDLATQKHPAASLTALANAVITGSSDPRRHAVAFNLYRISFGIDPVDLPDIELSTSDLSLEPSGASPASSSSTTSSGPASEWGDWQAAYHWAAIVLQGRAPPPPGTFLLVPAEQRLAQATQSAAAFRVFAHLAKQGHPRGIFGIGRHLLSTLEKSVDPTALASMPATASSGQALNKAETLAEVERLYRLAGEGGVEEAWFELGSIYAQGKWVRKDDAKARSFLEEGVERNSPRACHALASLLNQEAQDTSVPASLSLGDSTNAKPETADSKQERLRRSLQLLERGASLGSVECAFAAGMRYLLQTEPPSEHAQQNASANSLDMSLDSSKASTTVDPKVEAQRAHVAKWGVEAQDEAAAKWFNVAVQGGNAVAMMNLARMYLESRVPPSEDAPRTRQQELIEASNLYAKILSKAMGPEGQRAKALAEVQAKIAASKGGKPEAGMSGGSGRLDDLGVRAEEGLKLVREELAALGQAS